MEDSTRPQVAFIFKLELVPSAFCRDRKQNAMRITILSENNSYWWPLKDNELIGELELFWRVGNNPWRFYAHYGRVDIKHSNATTGESEQ